MTLTENRILDIQFSDPGAEPVTLDEAKAQLNMLFETSGSYEFDDDDLFITSLITQCRSALEKYTGCSLIERTVSIIVSYGRRGRIKLPYGPVVSVDTVLDSDGDDIDDPQIIGSDFKWYEGPLTSHAAITYSAGYEELPADLKRALLEEIVYRYNNRSSDDSEPIRRDLADQYRRVTWLL